jgi:glutathione synthase/RimK-type ligase-like ATP-grasp enzyme
MSVLVITNKWDSTADVVVHKLAERNVKTFRLNTEEVCGDTNITLRIENSLFEGGFFSLKHEIKMSEIKSVYFRRPLYPELKDLDPDTREFVVGEITAYLTWLWFALSDRFWVSSFAAIRHADSKIKQLKIAPSLGFNIPDTVITNQPEVALSFFKKHNGCIVNKVLARGAVQVDGERKNIYTNPVSAEMLEYVDTVSLVPCVFQEKIEKKVELRITVVGNNVFATEIHSQQNEQTKNDWRHYDLDNTPHHRHVLPENVKASCLALLKYYGLVFGAIDMILTPDGRYVFLEINPNGQWGWIEDLTKFPISDSIVDLLEKGGL